MSLLPEINYYTFSLLLGGVIALVSGVSVYFKGERIPQNRAWLWLNISTAVWSFGYLAMIVSQSERDALLSNWVLHFGAIFIPFFYFLFIVHTTDSYKKYKKYLYISGAFLISFFFLNTTTLFVKGVLPKYSFNYAPDAGPLYIYFTLYFFVLVILAISALLLRIPKTHGEEASRLKYILWASIAGFAGGGSVFFLTFNINIPPYLLITFSIYPMIIAYAILKYHLFNIRLILVELAILLLNLFLFLNVFTSNGKTDLILNASVSVAILAFSIVLMSGIYKDIRNRERIEELAYQMQVSNERLQMMEQSKTEFVSIASHQLRTPLTVIKGYSSMILEGTFGTLTESARDAIEKLYKSSERIVSLVEDLLVVSRLEQGRMTLQFETINLTNIMQDTLAEFAQTFDESGLTSSLTADNEKKFLSQVDEKRFKQVIKHLLTNAIQHTPPPGVIHVTISEDLIAGKNRISISDTGAGMTTEQIRGIFDRFDLKVDALNKERRAFEKIGEQQLDGTDEASDKKTPGIGLYIAQEIVHAHNGNLRIESAGVNRGTTFIIELPRSLV